MKVFHALAAAFVAVGLTADAGKIELKTTRFKPTLSTLDAVFYGSTSSDCLYQYLYLEAASGLLKTPGTSTPKDFVYVEYVETSCTEGRKVRYLRDPTLLSITGKLERGFQVTLEGTGTTDNPWYCPYYCGLPDDYYYYGYDYDCEQCEYVPFSINATLTPSSAAYSLNCVRRFSDSGLYRVTSALKGQGKEATVTSLSGYIGDSTLPPTLEDLEYGTILKVTQGYLEITKPA
jgi:hypothetical protein